MGLSEPAPSTPEPTPFLPPEYHPAIRFPRGHSDQGNDLGELLLVVCSQCAALVDERHRLGHTTWHHNLIRAFDAARGVPQ